jgi:glycosyltransferase involved in cell wall biosynthesis
MGFAIPYCVDFMKVLYIGDNDLVSSRFNGYDYYDYLKERGVESCHLVTKKMSDKAYVCKVKPLDVDFTLSVIKDKLFLEADIIHLQLIHNTQFDLNYLPFITKIKPTVITLHDPFFLGGHCIHHFDCNKWETHCRDCRYLERLFNIKADDTALRFELKKLAIQDSDIFAIETSEWIGAKVKNSPIWEQKKTYRLPFGVNQKIFKPDNIKEARKRLNIKENAVVLMFRATDTPFKGMNLIKESLKKVIVSKEVVLITVDHRRLLKDLKGRFAIREYGWVRDSAFLAQLYQASDIVLMPSEAETFGLMAVEAMSCGKMVLTTNKTALCVIVNSPECGISVEHDADAFTEKLQYLIENIDEMRERGKRSFEFARANYDLKTHIEKLMAIYMDIIRRHSLLPVNKLIIDQLIKYSDDYYRESRPSKKSVSKILIRILRKVYKGFFL